MASKHQKSMEDIPAQDAVDLLIADHQRVARLFADFQALKETGSDEAKSGLVLQICQELAVHTALEEELFYPAVRKAIDDDDLMDEAVVEHAGAKVLIAQLQTAHPDDDLYDAQVTVLGEQIAHHVEEEEGSMFPQAKHAEIDTLSLGAALLKRKAELLADPGALAAAARGVSDSADGVDGPPASDPPTPARTRRHPRPATRTQASRKGASHKSR